jgi:hypothetical protein
MHLLGNMWGQQWDISDLFLPFPNASRIEFTQELINQEYTPRKMFEVAEEFFTSINLSPMPELFWKNSIIEKPRDRDIICHARYVSLPLIASLIQHDDDVNLLLALGTLQLTTTSALRCVHGSRWRALLRSTMR